MSSIPTKRRNPFEKTLTPETPVQEPQPKVEEPVVEPKVEEPVEEVYVEPKKGQTKVKKTAVVETDDDREKYTATMETSLRRQIKIYCATNGIMFSEFIEIACREKLRREGIR